MNYRVEVWKNGRWMVVETCMLIKEAVEEAYLCKKAHHLKFVRITKRGEDGEWKAMSEADMMKEVRR